MRMTSIIKTFAWIALLAWTAAAGIKYVAIVESDIDEGSGASEKVSRADMRLVTAELRREAVKNLPPKKYVIMTSETVMAQGGAVLEECADENCVITLGSKIGADYIVRGTVSKLGAKFTLQVEMYETENGNLVASCDPVRSASIEDLVEKAAVVCAEMFKTWLATQESEADPKKAGESGKTRQYTGVNYTLVNSPEIKSSILPPSVSYEWINVEAGWLKSSGLFYGIDLGVGFGTGYNREDELALAIDAGIDVGYIYRLPYGFALSPGGSIGYRLQYSAGKEVVVYHDTYYDKDNERDEDCEEINNMFYFGPFVKARWYFIEVSYRGIVGRSETAKHIMGEETRHGESRWYWINKVNVGLYVEF